MVASQNQIIRFFSQQDTLFTIPVYQRNYDWTHKECEQLYNDIIEAAVNPSINAHFVGSVVYLHDDVYSTTGPKYLTVIDGQQRLTTLTLIWIALYRRCLEQGEQRKADAIFNKYLINQYLDGEERVKLKPTENNAAALSFLLQGDTQREFPQFSRLVDNFQFFYQRIQPDQINQVEAGIAKLIYVDIALERGKDDPQRIFESLNSTGLALSQGDLIRNYILMDLPQKLQNRLFNQYWQPIEELTTESETRRALLSDFIRHFLTFQFREIPTKNRVYEEFKKAFKFVSNERREEVLKDLKTYASYYNRLINPENEPNPALRKQFMLIQKLEINVSFPFLLEVYHDYHEERINQQTFVEVLELIQTYVWRRFIVGLPTNALNKIFLRLYRDVDTDQAENYLPSLQRALLRSKGTGRFPLDEEVIHELRLKDMYNIRSKNRSYFLERLENHQNREPVRIEGNDHITVEHIFPQRPDAVWRESLNEEDFRKMQNQYLHTIANLTLSGNNGALGNKSFQEKRDLPERGYRDSRLYLNRQLAQLECWGPAELDARFQALTDRFLQIWPFPQVELETISGEEEINIFDVDDPTGRTLEYITFWDQVHEIKVHRKLLHEVARRMFEINPQVFLKPEIRQRLKLTTDPEAQGMKTPLAISDTYYIDGWLSAREIFNRVKLILQASNVYDELFVKFKEE